MEEKEVPGLGCGGVKTGKKTNKPKKKKKDRDGKKKEKKAGWVCCG